MRSIYLMTDIEGVAGVVSFSQQTYSDGRYYDYAKRLLTAEVNAAVEGLLAEGVEDILVCDGHGSGGMWFDDLHPAAKLMHGRPMAPHSVRDPITSRYDACAIIGQHAMAGVPTSNLNHTQSSLSVDRYTLNGQPIGEIAQFALYQGAFGQPMIFLTGELDACREAEALIPGITTVSVKQGLSRGSAISLAAPESRRRIKEGVIQAVRRHREDPIAPLVWPGPYTLEKRYFTTEPADAAAIHPGVERVDGQTVRLKADDIREIIYR